MKIAIEGCAHGALEKIYETIKEIEQKENIKVDLLLCCGDFQSTRNLEDLETMAAPKKYQDICTFYKYYKGELQAPMLTIFIGGNHEASNYLQELPYGGWVAPNIYYLGYAGVVRVNGIRVAGISGIYSSHDYLKGRFEFSPYTESTKRSVYHVRQLEVFRLKQLSGNVDIVISHDWPRGIYKHGNQENLARFKPYLREDMENGQLGSPPYENLLNILQPSYWFAAHMHCKFAALVTHMKKLNISAGKEEKSERAEGRCTKFLALDKCLPRRRFLQIIDIESKNHTDDEGQLHFEYDLEWLTILYLTNHLTNTRNSYYYLPNEKGNTGERYNFTPTDEEMSEVLKKFENVLKIPENFCRTVEPYDPKRNFKTSQHVQPKSQINPQSLQFCDTLGIDDPLTLAMLIGGHELSHSSTLDGTFESNLNDSSSIADEPSSLNTSNASMVSPLKRRSVGSSSIGLNLPKPKAIESNAITKADELSSDSDDKVEQEADTHNCGITPQELPTLHIDSPKPPLKKFRRRNQDIYQSKTDDEDENCALNT
uniref:Lariat debranching enzyme C-terminal domain-containing protein n=1 Tax=Glossina morsitans morsitans TaxID=37546 RepID=A0A1B0G3Y7_GLOMM